MSVGPTQGISDSDEKNFLQHAITQMSDGFHVLQASVMQRKNTVESERQELAVAWQGDGAPLFQSKVMEWLESFAQVEAQLARLATAVQDVTTIGVNTGQDVESYSGSWAVHT